MRVFVTGATGFVGSRLVPELLAAGHRVVGLSRSDTGAASLARRGADVVRGDVNDLDRLRTAAKDVDAVIHAAFDHGPGALAESSENDRKVIETLGATLAGSDRPLLLTSGTGLVRSKGDRPAMESDEHLTVAEFRRAATEDAADALIAAGRRVVVVRLPQVHDTEKQGRLSIHVQLARKHGRVAYVGDGAQGLPAAHVSDVARLYRLALEDGRAGARWHAVAEESVSMKKIAEAIGKRLNLPAVSIDEDEAKAYFGPLAMLAAKDLAASGFFTQRELAWKPTGPDLLTDLQHLEGSPA